GARDRPTGGRTTWGARSPMSGWWGTAWTGRSTTGICRTSRASRRTLGGGLRPPSETSPQEQVAPAKPALESAVIWRKPNSSGRAFDFLHRLKAGPRTEDLPRRRASEAGLALLVLWPPV